MSSCVCKISFKSVQVCGGCCKMFRGLTFLGTQCIKYQVTKSYSLNRPTATDSQINCLLWLLADSHPATDAGSWRDLVKTHADNNNSGWHATKVENDTCHLNQSTLYETKVLSQTEFNLWRGWLGGRKGIQPVKNWVVGCWHGYLSGARCRLAYGPADATATHCLLLQ